MGLFLTSLGILFGVTLIAFLVLRLQIGRAWPDLPPLPRILWISTSVIVLSSATMQWGLSSIRRGRGGVLPVAMFLTLALGFAFLALQSVAWLRWLAPAVERWNQSEEWRFALTSFYLFTALHALHVVGGLLPMTLVTWRSLRPGRYSATDHAGVHLCAMYWHFLAVVWLVLFATLMIGV